MRSSFGRVYATHLGWADAVAADENNRRFNLRRYGHEQNPEDMTGQATWLDAQSYEELQKLRLVAHKRAKAEAKRERRIAAGLPCGAPVRPADPIKLAERPVVDRASRWGSIKKRKAHKPFSIDGFK